MTPRTAREPQVRIAGVRARTTNRTPERIGELWGQFHEQKIAALLDSRADANIYSVYSNYESDATGEFDVLIGYAVPRAAMLPEALSEVVVPEGSYAVFPVSGPLPQGIANAWAEIWEAPLHRAFRCDFERYHPDGSITIHVGII